MKNNILLNKKPISFVKKEIQTSSLSKDNVKISPINNSNEKVINNSEKIDKKKIILQCKKNFRPNLFNFYFSKTWNNNDLFILRCSQMKYGIGNFKMIHQQNLLLNKKIFDMVVETEKIILRDIKFYKNKKLDIQKIRMVNQLKDLSYKIKKNSIKNRKNKEEFLEAKKFLINDLKKI